MKKTNYELISELFKGVKVNIEKKEVIKNPYELIKS